MKRILIVPLIAIFSFLQINIYARILPSGVRQSIVSSSMITSPGTYFVANDFVGTITIAADNVELDLNYKKVSAAGTSISATSHTDIIIKNGILENAFDNHILITSCTNVTIEGIDFIGSQTAIDIQHSEVINITNCSLKSATKSCLSFLNSTDISCRFLEMVSNSCQRAFRWLSCRNILLEDTNITRNSFTVTLATQYGALQIESCGNCILNRVNIEDNAVSNTSASALVTHLLLGLTSYNTIINNCLFTLNSIDDVSDNVAIVGFDGSNEMTLYNVNVSNNSTGSALFSAFLFEGSTISKVQNCAVQNHSVSGVFNGFWLNTGISDADFKECQVNKNTSGSGLFGFQLLASKGVYDSCLITDNSAGGSFFGIDIEANDITLINNIIKNNSAGVTGRAILVDIATQTIVRNNILISNQDFGIDNLSGGNFTPWSNQAENQTTNFSSIPAAIIVTYTKSTGAFSATPNPYHNIDVV